MFLIFKGPTLTHGFIPYPSSRDLKEQFTPQLCLVLECEAVMFYREVHYKDMFQ